MTPCTCSTPAAALHRSISEVNAPPKSKQQDQQQQGQEAAGGAGAQGRQQGRAGTAIAPRLRQSKPSAAPAIATEASQVRGQRLQFFEPVVRDPCSSLLENRSAACGNASFLSVWDCQSWPAVAHFAVKACCGIVSTPVNR